MHRSLTNCVLALAAGLFLMGAASPELRVRVQDGKLTLHADGVPLSGVLWAIVAQTGIELSLAEDAAAGGPVVVESFKDLPIDKGVERLLRKHLRDSGYVLVTDAKGKLTSLRILPGAFGESSSATVGRPPSQAATAPSRERSTGRDASRRPRVAPEDRDDAIADALDATRKATDPAALIEALLALGDFQDARTIEALRSALQSERGDVRKAALEAMREGYVSDPTALADVRATISGDPDPAVKQAALDVMVRYDESVEAQALLRTLATDQSSPYSKFAAKELKRMEGEQQQRRLPDTQVRQVPVPGNQRGAEQPPSR
jgi:hypothetical protein